MMRSAVQRAVPCLATVLLLGCGGAQAPGAGPREHPLPWTGHTPSGKSLRIVAERRRPIECVDIHTGPYDMSDYCVPQSRTKPLDAGTELYCGTGDALIVGSVARRGLTMELRPEHGRVRRAIHFAGRTSTGQRRLLALSFAASSLPAKLVVLGPTRKVIATHHFASESARCAGHPEKFLFGWI
jgi:hypothetical protein